MREDRDYTSDLWINEFTGKTYGEMNPAEILESQINHCLKSMMNEFDFKPRTLKDYKRAYENFESQYSMLSNWIYIYAKYNKGLRHE
jgi:hypothetical protein